MEPRDASGKTIFDAITFRLAALEKDIAFVKDQFEKYELSRENELKLVPMKEALERVAVEVVRLKERIEVMGIAIALDKQIAQNNQDKLVSRALWTVLSFIIGGSLSVLLIYVAHLFGR